MRLQQWVLFWFKKLAVGNWTAAQLAKSFCVGTYIAFCPFVGFHTWITLFVSWAFSLNVAVVFAASCGINNPWTMLPIYGADYVVGDFILCRCLGTSSASVCSLDPAWMGMVNNFLHTYIGIERVSLWGFLLGGNILGIVISLSVYPLIKRLFEAVKNKKEA